MNTIVLDHDIVLGDPSILSMRKAGWRLVVDDTLVSWVDGQSDGRYQGIKGLLADSAAKGFVEIIHGASSAKMPGTELVFAPGSAIAVANSIAELNTDDLTVLASDNRFTQRFGANFRNFTVIDGAELRTLLASDAVNDKQLLKQAQAIVRNRVLHLLASLAAGIILTLLVQYSLSNIDKVVAALTTAGTFVGLMTCGVALFALRCWQRLTYGILELGFGLWAVYLGLQHDLGGDSQMLGMVKLVGGMYVLVRGLDNIGKGLKPTRLYGRWSRIFPE